MKYFIPFYGIWFLNRDSAAYDVVGVVALLWQSVLVAALFIATLVAIL